MRKGAACLHTRLLRGVCRLWVSRTKRISISTRVQSGVFSPLILRLHRGSFHLYLLSQNTQSVLQTSRQSSSFLTCYMVSVCRTLNAAKTTTADGRLKLSVLLSIFFQETICKIRPEFSFNHFLWHVLMPLACCFSFLHWMRLNLSLLPNLDDGNCLLNS